MEIKIDNTVFKEEKIYTIVGTTKSGKSKFLEYIWNNYMEKTSIYIQNVNDFFLNKTIKEELLLSVPQKNNQNENKTIKDALKLVGIEDENREIKTLSLSEKTKVQLASILIQNKDIILLDEPTIYLDKIEKQNLMKLLKKLKHEHKTIIVATRDVDFALHISDDICLFHHKILYFDEKNEVMKHMDLFEKEGLNIPDVLAFSKKVKDKKNIQIGYRLDINDLIKDIYRNVT